jgi:hypothetical protein
MLASSSGVRSIARERATIIERCLTLAGRSDGLGAAAVGCSALGSLAAAAYLWTGAVPVSPDAAAPSSSSPGARFR